MPRAVRTHFHQGRGHRAASPARHGFRYSHAQSENPHYFGKRWVKCSITRKREIARDDITLGRGAFAGTPSAVPQTPHRCLHCQVLTWLPDPHTRTPVGAPNPASPSPPPTSRAWDPGLPSCRSAPPDPAPRPRPPPRRSAAPAPAGPPPPAGRVRRRGHSQLRMSEMKTARPRIPSPLDTAGIFGPRGAACAGGPGGEAGGGDSGAEGGRRGRSRLSPSRLGFPAPLSGPPPRARTHARSQAHARARSQARAAAARERARPGRACRGRRWGAPCRLAPRAGLLCEPQLRVPGPPRALLQARSHAALPSPGSGAACCPPWGTGLQAEL